MIGPAALICAQTLRQHEFNGRIVMITKDENFPYDRTKLSKLLGQGIEFEKIKLREKEWYEVSKLLFPLVSKLYSAFNRVNSFLNYSGSFFRQEILTFSPE